MMVMRLSFKYLGHNRDLLSLLVCVFIHDEYERMHDTGHVAQYSKDQINPKWPLEAFLQQHA